MLTSVLALAKLLTLLQGEPKQLVHHDDFAIQACEYVKEDYIELEKLYHVPYADGTIHRHDTLCMLPGITQVPIASATGLIKSIQAVAATIGTSSSSQTQTGLTAVVVNNSVIVWGGWQGNNTSASDATNDCAYWTIASTTSVTATRSGSSASVTVTLKGFLVEFNSSVLASAVKSGTITIGSGSTSGNSTAFTAVNTNNSVCLFAGFTSSTNGSTGQAFTRVTLGSSTQATATRNTATTNTITASFFVIEFASGILNSNVQTGTITGVSGTPQNSTLGTAVTVANTWLIYNGLTVTNTGNSLNEIGWISLTSTTNVQYTSGTPSIVAYTVCEFATGKVKSNKHGSITTTTTSGTDTFTAVTVAFTFIQCLGNICNTTTASVGFLDIVITNTTTATAERNGTTTSTTLGYCMMEFNP